MDTFPLETLLAKETALQVEEGVASVATSREETETEREVWRLLRRAMVSYCDVTVGVEDPECTKTLNYDQVFIRGSMPSALTFLMALAGCGGAWEATVKKRLGKR